MSDKDVIHSKLSSWLSNVLTASEFSMTALEGNTGSGFSAETLYATITYKKDGASHKKDIVIRRQNEDSELFLNADLNLQYRMMEALNEKTSIPVPGVIGIELDRSIFGTPFLIMERSVGRVAHQSPNYNLEGWLKDFTPAQRHQTWENGLRTLADIHKLDWHNGFEFLNINDANDDSNTGLNYYLNWVEEWYLWARQDRPHPVSDLALKYLKSNRPDNAPVSVLWGDPSPSNMLFNNDGSLSTVLDWEMATLGPPEADLAWWLFFDNLFSAGMGVERLEGLPDRAASIAMYEQFLGRKVENLEYYDILASFRMSIIGIRAVDRQIELGNIPADTTARTGAPIMRILAGQLGEPLPEIGPDFMAFSAAIKLD